MPQRLAGALSLTVFAVCLLIGGFSAGNGFGTVVARALVAMAGTFVVALVVGAMARKMIEENVSAAAKSGSTKIEEIESNNSSASDR